MTRLVGITGASGFIGRHLRAALEARGDRVIALGRDVTLPADCSPDAIVNLAGARILGMPWTRRRRQLLRDSRIDLTRRLVAGLAGRAQRPTVLVNASAIGYYGVRDATPVDESAAPQPIFQSQLCADWEQAAAQAGALGMRVVLLRFGVVLGSDGGALPQLALPVRLGLGTVLGGGNQGSPWIHIDDAVRLILFALDEARLSGPVNAVSPEQVSHRTFQQTLARVLRRPLWMRVPAPVLRAALGEMAQLLVDGSYVLPLRAREAGFMFQHETLEPALRDLLRHHPHS